MLMVTSLSLGLRTALAGMVSTVYSTDWKTPQGFVAFVTQRSFRSMVMRPRALSTFAFGVNVAVNIRSFSEFWTKLDKTPLGVSWVAILERLKEDTLVV
ncbi:hypothetical protein D8B23_20440 [Verminephrobacter aporrectodeae subsp. tuberculatae]|nr:hypothetical protein [Verminephrobacter aporrectodeae subsp. tuberculatae]